MLFAYQVGPELGEFSLTKAGEPVAEFLCGYKTKDSIAQKFHLLIVAHARTASRLQRLKLARLGTVGQGLLQQLYPLEAVAQSCLQQRNVTRLHDLVRDIGLRTSDIGLQTSDLSFLQIPEGWDPMSEVCSPMSGFSRTSSSLLRSA